MSSVGLRRDGEAFGSRIIAWITWVVATIAATMVGLIACLVLGLITFGAGALIAGALGGLFMGVGQGWVFQHYGFELATAQERRRWLLSNAIGGEVAVVAGSLLWMSLVAAYVLFIPNRAADVLDFWYMLFALLSLATAFVLYTIAQWRLLRQHFSRSWLLIPISCIAGLIGFVVSTALIGPIIAQVPGPDGGIATGFIALLSVQIMIGAAIWAVITGIGFAVMLDKG